MSGSNSMAWKSPKVSSNSVVTARSKAAFVGLPDYSIEPLVKRILTEKRRSDYDLQS